MERFHCELGELLFELAMEWIVCGYAVQSVVRELIAEKTLALLGYSCAPQQVCITFERIGAHIPSSCSLRNKSPLHGRLYGQPCTK